MGKVGFEEGGKEYHDYCPKCGHNSFFWNVKKNVGWCFFCETTFFDRPRNILPSDVQIRRRILPEIDPETGDLLSSPPSEVEKYLLSRRVTTWTTKKCGLKFQGDSIYFPVASPSPEYPEGSIYRKITNKFYSATFQLAKKTGGYLFGLNQLEPADTIILVEGTFDVLSPGLLGKAVAIMGTNLYYTTELWVKLNYKNVIVWLDPDAEHKAVKIAEMFRDKYELNASAIIGHDHDPGDCQCFDFLRELVK